MKLAESSSIVEKHVSNKTSDADKFSALAQMMKAEKKDNKNTKNTELNSADQAFKTDSVDEENKSQATALHAEDRLGVLGFALPKLIRSIRPKKKPFLYHSYSFNDNRYMRSHEVQYENPNTIDPKTCHRLPVIKKLPTLRYNKKRRCKSAKIKKPAYIKLRRCYTNYALFMKLSVFPTPKKQIKKESNAKHITINEFNDENEHNADDIDNQDTLNLEMGNHLLVDELYESGIDGKESIGDFSNEEDSVASENKEISTNFKEHHSNNKYHKNKSTKKASKPKITKGNVSGKSKGTLNQSGDAHAANSSPQEEAKNGNADITGNPTTIDSTTSNEKEKQYKEHEKHTTKTTNHKDVTSANIEQQITVANDKNESKIHENDNSGYKTQEGKNMQQNAQSTKTNARSSASKENPNAKRESTPQRNSSRKSKRENSSHGSRNQGETSRNHTAANKEERKSKFYLNANENHNTAVVQPEFINLQRANDIIDNLQIVMRPNHEQELLLDSLQTENTQLKKIIQTLKKKLKAKENIDAQLNNINMHTEASLSISRTESKDGDEEKDGKENRDKEDSISLKPGESIVRELEEDDYKDIGEDGKEMLGKSPHGKKKEKKPKAASESRKEVIRYLSLLYKNRERMLNKRLPLKPTLKVITGIYNSILTAYNKDTFTKFNKLFCLKKPFPDYVYQYLVNKFGDQKMSVKKLRQILSSCIVNQKIPRVHLFLGILGLTNDLEEDDANFYIRCLGYIQSMKIGINITNNEMNSSHYIPYVRSTELCKQAFQGLSKDAYSDLIKSIEKLKEVDPKKINNSGIIDIDNLMLSALNQYRTMIGKIRDYIADIFNASDLDGNKTLEFFEFYILYRIIEPKKYSFQNCCSLFTNSCDYVIDNGQKIQVITFDHFANICEAEHLFGQEAQNDFLKYTKTEDQVKLVNILKSHFNDMTNDAYLRIKTMISKSDYLKNVWAYLKKMSNKVNSREARSAWMLYKFVEGLSVQLFHDEQEELVMGDLEYAITYNKEPSAKQLLEWKEEGNTEFMKKYLGN